MTSLFYSVFININRCDVLNALFDCYMADANGQSAQKVDSGEENSPATPAGIRTHDLLIMSLALLTTELSLPQNTVINSILFNLLCVLF